MTDAAGAQPTRHLLSILTPVYDPPREAFEACVRSVLAQDYDHWEWCIVDDCSTAPWVWPRLQRAGGDGSAHQGHRRRRERRHLGGHERAPSALATGEFVVLLDHDDQLTPRRARRGQPRAVGRPDRRLPLLRRGQGRRRRQLLRPVREAGLVARAAALPELLLPPLGAAALDRHRRRRLPIRVRRRPGLRHRPPRHRACPHGRPHPPRALPLAGRRGLDGDERRRQAVRRRRRPARRRRRARNAVASPARSSTSATATTASGGELTSTPKVSIIVPTRGTVGRIWGLDLPYVVNMVDSLQHVDVPEHRGDRRLRHRDDRRHPRRDQAPLAVPARASSSTASRSTSRRSATSARSPRPVTS